MATLRTLDDNLNLRVLKFDEWQAKARSPEYRQLQQTLAQSRAKPKSPSPLRVMSLSSHACHRKWRFREEVGRSAAVGHSPASDG